MAGAAVKAYIENVNPKTTAPNSPEEIETVFCTFPVYLAGG
jgi:hypothetical protein